MNSCSFKANLTFSNQQMHIILLYNEKDIFLIVQWKKKAFYPSANKKSSFVIRISRPLFRNEILFIYFYYKMTKGIFFSFKGLEVNIFHIRDGEMYLFNTSGYAASAWRYSRFACSTKWGNSRFWVTLHI